MIDRSILNKYVYIWRIIINVLLLWIKIINLDPAGGQWAFGIRPRGNMRKFNINNN